MKKNKYHIKKNDIEIMFQHISQNIHDKKWWKDEKKRLKAIKLYKKLNLKKRFKLTKKNKDKYYSHFLTKLNDWCEQCLNNKQWKRIKNSINQAQEPTKEIKQEKTISLSDKAYELLHDVARQEKISISELILSKLEDKEEKLIVESNDTEPVVIIEAIKNKKLSEKKLITHKKTKKGNKNIIELWHYAGGQCQALSKVTQKRCKRITPNLSIKHQVIGNIDYQFAVCHSHNNDTSQLDQSNIDLKS